MNGNGQHHAGQSGANGSAKPEAFQFLEGLSPEELERLIEREVNRP